MIFPTAVSDGQFYSPPESLAGNITHLLCGTKAFIILIVMSFINYYTNNIS